MPITRRTFLWVSAAAGLSLAVVLVTILLSGHNADGWLLCARYTARLSFLCFLFAFLAPRFVLKFTDEDARDAFLAFSAAHMVHFGALLTYLQVSGTSMNLGQLTVGALAYLILVGSAIWLVAGRGFPRFHVPMLHYILFVFALTYSTRLPDDETRIVGVVGVGTSFMARALRHLRRPRAE